MNSKKVVRRIRWFIYLLVGMIVTMILFNNAELRDIVNDPAYGALRAVGTTFLCVSIVWIINIYMDHYREMRGDK